MNGTGGQPLTYQIVTDKPVDRYGATGLAPGLAVNTSTGVITGTPIASGSFQGIISASSAQGGASTSFDCEIQAGPPAPGIWQSQDVGAVGAVDGASESGNPITVRGSGADIWGNVDGFRFLYRALRGDGQIEARVAAIGNTHGWAQAGLMIRESLAPGAMNVLACVTAGNGLGLQAARRLGRRRASPPDRGERRRCIGSGRFAQATRSSLRFRRTARRGSSCRP